MGDSTMASASLGGRGAALKLVAVGETCPTCVTHKMKCYASVDSSERMQIQLVAQKSASKVVKETAISTKLQRIQLETQSEMYDEFVFQK